MRRGANVHAVVPATRDTTLMWALRKGSAAVARALLDAGVDAGAINKEGHNAVYVASKSSSAEVRSLMARLRSGKVEL